MCKSSTKPWFLGVVFNTRVEGLLLTAGQFQLAIGLANSSVSNAQQTRFWQSIHGAKRLSKVVCSNTNHILEKNSHSCVWCPLLVPWLCQKLDAVEQARQQWCESRFFRISGTSVFLGWICLNERHSRSVATDQKLYCIDSLVIFQSLLWKITILRTANPQTQITQWIMASIAMLTYWRVTPGGDDHGTAILEGAEKDSMGWTHSHIDVYKNIYIYAIWLVVWNHGILWLSIYGPVLRLSTPPLPPPMGWVPRYHPPFPSICKLLAAFLRSSFVFARSLQHFWLSTSHLLGTCYLLGDLRSTYTPSKYLRDAYVLPIVILYIYIYTRAMYLLPIYYLCTLTTLHVFNIYRTYNTFQWCHAYHTYHTYHTYHIYHTYAT